MSPGRAGNVVASRRTKYSAWPLIWRAYGGASPFSTVMTSTVFPSIS